MKLFGKRASSSNIALCPFCGNEPDAKFFIKTYRVSFDINCRNCGTNMSRYIEGYGLFEIDKKFQLSDFEKLMADTIQDWNRRASNIE